MLYEPDEVLADALANSLRQLGISHIVCRDELELREQHGITHMEIDTAISGFQAIDMVRGKRYDLVFMDHMMPEMDGVETTHRIRAMEGEYFQAVPIIALTANAILGAREKFLEQGPRKCWKSFGLTIMSQASTNFFRPSCEARNRLLKGAGSQFDPELVSLFISMIDKGIVQ